MTVPNLLPDGYDILVKEDRDSAYGYVFAVYSFNNGWSESRWPIYTDAYLMQAIRFAWEHYEQSKTETA